MATNNAINASTPIGVVSGGLGATSFTAHGVLVGAGTTSPTPLSVGTNGQVLVGSTGADPAFATLTSADSSILYTTGAASLGVRSRLVQQVSATLATTLDCTVAIPDDDTIPQNTEGTQVITATITPKNSANTLYIFAQMMGGTAGTATNVKSCGIALFQDTTASALSARQVSPKSTTVANGYTQFNLTHAMTAGTTSATTFKIRIGPNATVATITINGIASGRTLGGVQIAILYILEFANS
jgi:hypothetical protein